MTIRDALTLGQKKLAASPSPTLDSRLLLEFVLGTSHSYLIAHDEENMSPEHERRFLSLLERAAAGEPIPYIIERTQFYGLTIQVSPAVLIPRPETEQLVDSALEWVAQKGNSFALPHIVDVGTGSGCIALALASKLRDAKIEATDVSVAALDLAKENARLLGYESRIAFYRGNLLDPIADAPNLIVANLPYIADHEWTALSDGVKWYEPDVALRGGINGLDGIRQLLAQASIKLTHGGALFLEIGWKQGEMVRTLVKSAFPDAQVEVLKDYAANDRIICIYTR